MKRYSMPFGRTIGHQHEHPERTASKSGAGLDGNVTFQVWSNREAMARSIRMQQRRESRYDDWRAVRPLTDTEGY